MRLIGELPCAPSRTEPAGRRGRDRWRSIAAHPAAAITLLIAAFWPVWNWYVRRIVDGSDEPLGLGALAIAGWLVWRESRARGWGGPAACRRWLVLLVIAIYAATFQFAPPLVRAILAMLALAVALPPMRGAAGVGGLLLLSLPLVATMQFYLGYPLRIFAAETSRAILAGLGYAVAREGTALRWAGESVLVDAPCSGVQMLWAGCVLASTLAAVRGLSVVRTMSAGLGAVIVIVAANALRAAALFFKEAGIVALADWMHAAIGLTAFAAAALAIGWMIRRLAASQNPPKLHPPPRKLAGFPRTLAAGCLIAAIVPALAARQSSPRETPDFGRWADRFDAQALVEIPLSARDQRFSADFPGRIARFTDGRCDFIHRLVSKPTRKLHSSADCFRGLGYTIAPQPALLDPQGRRWARFTATRGACRLIVRERIEGADGTSWTDVSAWFWQASLRPATGPWLATTVIESHP